MSLSLWEGIGVANLEAIACGCHVVMSDIGPQSEIARNIGLRVYNSNDVYGISNSINSLLQTPNDTLKSIVNNARLFYSRSDMINSYKSHLFS